MRIVALAGEALEVEWVRERGGQIETLPFRYTAPPGAVWSARRVVAEPRGIVPLTDLGVHELGGEKWTATSYTPPPFPPASIDPGREIREGGRRPVFPPNRVMREGREVDKPPRPLTPEERLRLDALALPAPDWLARPEPIDREALDGGGWLKGLAQSVALALLVFAFMLLLVGTLETFVPGWLHGSKIPD